MAVNEPKEKLEELRAKIELLQDSVDMWSSIGLSRKTILILLQHKTKLSRRAIESVLEGVESLYEEYFAED